jgi:hypothetical protein
MNITCLHVNIERSKHIDLIDELLREKQSEIVCICEAIDQDVKQFAKDHEYHYAFVPEISYKDGSVQGVAILSKHTILETHIYRYDENETKVPPAIEFIERHDPKDRPQFRFHYHSVLLHIIIEKNGQKINVSTAHFPVVDHTTPGYPDHTFDEIEDIHDLNYARGYFDRLLGFIKTIPNPVIFTSDLNNPRGEYMYDALAHELVDHVSRYITTTIDPTIHQVKNLELVVDTIMTSPDISCANFEVIEGVSDHKALFAHLSIS